MDSIEIQAFEADTRASKGLTAAHILAAAEAYDGTKNPAPLVFGHPASDTPALGVVAKARAEGSKLFLTLSNIAKEVVDGVKARRILNRSIAFWAPDHPSNPTPGVYSIRHLGLLGGQAPAIPGMPALRFSADESALEGEEGPADAIVFAVEAPAPTGVQEVLTPAPSKEPDMLTAEQIAAKDAEFAATAKTLEEREAEIARREKDAADREKTFAAAETARREGENAASIDAAIAAGKVLPAEKDDLAAIFNALPVQAMTFSAGELEPRIALGKFLEGLPKRTAITEGQKSPEGEFSASNSKDAADAALADANKRQATAYKGTPAA